MAKVSSNSTQSNWQNATRITLTCFW